MGKTTDEGLKRMNTTGVCWDDMTEEQRKALEAEWHKIVTNPKELYCTCPRTSCMNNHNCKNCVALHRFYDGVSDCFREHIDELQASVPQSKKYNVHLKIQSDGMPRELIDESDPDGSRERLVAYLIANKIDPSDRWKEILADPENTKCTCPRTDCRYHGNCVRCVALHRHFGGFPYCTRYIVDKVDAIVEEFGEKTDGAAGGSDI